MSRKSQRIIMIVILLSSIILGVFIIASQFKNNIVFFFSPTELLTHKYEKNKIIRVGGLIKKDSVKKHGHEISFILTDNHNEILVHYQGILPNLFRESQGMVAKGKLVNGTLIASELLTKHDEKYMPKEVSKILDQK